ERCADRSPGDPVARLGEAEERRLEPSALGQQVLGGDPAILEDELGGDRGPEAPLAVHEGPRKSGPLLLDEEAANRLDAGAGFRVGYLRPQDRDVAARP